MTLESRLDQWSRGWRGPLLAALLALIAGLPGLVFLPPMDRDESRFAQASAQMMETRDFVSIRYQDQPRNKKPVGIHWLQTAAVTAVSDVEARQIWAYRIPSLLGAMLAAAACAWGASAFLGARGGLIAGAILAASQMLAFEAGIAKTDAVLCGAVTLAMAAFGRLYLASNGGPPAGRRERLLLWLGLALSALDKGPIGPIVAGLAGLALLAFDRRAPWLKTLGWSWGPIVFAAVVLPWAMAITVMTDGAFWSSAIGADLAPKLRGGQESHGAAPGYHLLLLSLLIFPATMLAPAAALKAWEDRLSPGIRFALAWLIPAWIAFELLPTKLPHYPLPTYGAIAWLMAAALMQPLGPRVKIAGAALSALVGGLLAAVTLYLTTQFGDAPDLTWAALTAGLFAAAGGVGAWFLLRGENLTALTVAGALGILAHASFFGGFAPSLDPLWVSKRVVAALDKAGLNPQNGVARGPVEVAGYAEPSLVFALGTGTGLGDGEDAADAIEAVRPAVVEKRQEAAFLKAMARSGLTPHPAGIVTGRDYSNGDAVVLTLYRGEALLPPPESHP